MTITKKWSISDHRLMAHALKLAQRGQYMVAPNPKVGCVLASGGQIVAEGWHQAVGEAHAEVMALANISTENPTQLECFVTLEPCSHYGRTPPCVDALIALNPKRVVVAMEDPNPCVFGKGLARLRAAGITVQIGLMAEQARQLNLGFVSRMIRNRPYVRIKLAMSIDGKIALKNGVSEWITSPLARQDSHRLRAASSAILTGIGTVLCDDPKLTVRDFEEAHRQPLRVVVDRTLHMPPTAKMLSLPGHTVIFALPHSAEQAAPLVAAGVEIITLGGGSDWLQRVLVYLAKEYAVNEVLVEAGPRILGALLEAQLFDELVIYMAPSILGHHARSAFNIADLSQMSQRFDLKWQKIRQIGTELKLIATPLLNS